MDVPPKTDHQDASFPLLSSSSLSTLESRLRLQTEPPPTVGCSRESTVGYVQVAPRDTVQKECIYSCIYTVFTTMNNNKFQLCDVVKARVPVRQIRNSQCIAALIIPAQKQHWRQGCFRLRRHLVFQGVPVKTLTPLARDITQRLKSNTIPLALAYEASTHCTSSRSQQQVQANLVGVLG
jgi:hypothetical protein